MNAIIDRPEINQRLTEVLKDEGLGQEAAAAKLQLSKGTISDLYVGKRAASTKTITAFLAKFPNISLNWLWLGEGSKYRNEGDTSVTTSNFRGSGNQIGAGSFESSGAGEIELLRMQLEGCKRELEVTRELVEAYKRGK